jgi:hypothetical protein
MTPSLVRHAVEPLPVRQIGHADSGIAGICAIAADQGWDQHTAPRAGEQSCELALGCEPRREPGELLGGLCTIGNRNDARCHCDSLRFEPKPLHREAWQNSPSDCPYDDVIGLSDHGRPSRGGQDLEFTRGHALVGRPEGFGQAKAIGQDRLDVSSRSFELSVPELLAFLRARFDAPIEVGVNPFDHRGGGITSILPEEGPGQYLLAICGVDPAHGPRQSCGGQDPTKSPIQDDQLPGHVYSPLVTTVGLACCAITPPPASTARRTGSSRPSNDAWPRP